jgi:hypothetical protein
LDTNDPPTLHKTHPWNQLPGHLQDFFFKKSTFDPDLEGNLDIKNPFNVDALDLVIAVDTSPITNPSFDRPMAVFISRMH